MNRRQILFATLAVLFVHTSILQADGTREIKILGKSESLVSGKRVTLGDIASISSPKVQDDPQIIELQRLDLIESPQPGKSATVSASTVLAKLREAHRDLSRIGYAFPRVMKIARAGRTLTMGEVEEAIRAALNRSNRDMELIRVNLKNSLVALPDYTTCTARFLSRNPNGAARFELVATTPEAEATSYIVEAQVEEWTTIPVASRAISSGSVIREGDISEARMSLRSVPPDAASATTQILGQEADRQINVGEVFRMNKLSIPAMISSGDQVLLRYKSALLEASTPGTALEDGIAGQSIRVRNDSTRRTILGTVIEPGLVGVNP